LGFDLGFDLVKGPIFYFLFLFFFFFLVFPVLPFFLSSFSCFLPFFFPASPRVFLLSLLEPCWSPSLSFVPYLFFFFLNGASSGSYSSS
jgi:hypothetical protein